MQALVRVVRVSVTIAAMLLLFLPACVSDAAEDFLGDIMEWGFNE